MVKALSLAICLGVNAAFGVNDGWPVNVKDFGAVGDGVHDDTLALQKAADSLHPDGELQEHRDWCFGRRRFFSYGKNKTGRIQEILLPEGTYRITGPVMFTYPTCVRGEGRVVVKNVTTDRDSFYFDSAYCMRLENVAFVGGRNQVRVWNGNRCGPVYVKGCAFRRASGVAFLCDELILKTDRDFGAAAVPGRPNVSPYVIAREADGRVKLTGRDPATLKHDYASALHVVEDCVFEDNACAIDSESDTQIFRDLTVRVPRTASGAAVRVHTVSHVARVKVEVARNPELEQYAFDADVTISVFSDCEVRSDRPLTAAILSRGYAYRSSILTRLAVKNMTLDAGETPLVRFAADTFPGLVAVHGVMDARAASRRRLFTFAREPVEGVTKDWYEAGVAQANIKMPRMADERAYGIVVEGVDGGAFDTSLPPMLETFRRPATPGLCRMAQARSTSINPAEYGREIRVEGVGTEDYRMTNDVDTARVQAAFDLAAQRRAGTVVLPAAWIRLARPIEVRGKTRVVGRGLSFVIGDDAGTIFRVGEGSDLAIENVYFQNGRHALEALGSKGRIRMTFCAFYDQKEEAIRAVSPVVPSGWRIEHTAGNAYAHYIYRGNANPMLFDATQANNTSEARPNGTYPPYHAYDNLEGGVLEMHDILCTPWFFESGSMTRTYLPPKPGEHGDFRYIDNRGTLRISGFRFGGEWGGLTPVYQFGPKAELYVEGGYSINNAAWLDGGQAQVVADSPETKATFVELGTARYTAQPSVFGAWKTPQGEYKFIKVVVENCYPFD